jgi:hypothetical protein
MFQKKDKKYFTEYFIVIYYICSLNYKNIIKGVDLKFKVVNFAKMMSFHVISLFYVIYIQLFVTIPGESCDSEQIVTKNGTKLNLYTNVRYSIKNKRNGTYLNEYLGSSFRSTPNFGFWNKINGIVLVQQELLEYMDLIAFHLKHHNMKVTTFCTVSFNNFLNLLNMTCENQNEFSL